jgi:hypothetical protein
MIAFVLLAVPLAAALAVWAFASVALRKPRPDHRARAWTWAERRGVTLTERSVPYVDTYLRNARALRFVCAGGAVLLLAAFTYGTGIDLGGIGYAWVLGGYLVGSVWAELSLARVPASSTTREASLIVRDPSRYRIRWVAVGQRVLPAALVVLAVFARFVPAAPEMPTTHGVDWWTSSNVRVQAVAAGVLGLISLAVTAWAQRHIVRRPQPRAEADLVAADEAMRTSSVHVLGVTQLVLCLLLTIAGVLHIAHTLPDTANGPASALIFVIAVAALGLWGLRIQPPGRGGGPVPPPPFAREAAAAIDLSAPGGPRWTAPRRPDLTALSVIVVLAVGLWGLRWVGPTNPDVDAFVTLVEPTRVTGPAQSGPTSQSYIVMVTNRSRLPVEILGIDTSDRYRMTGTYNGSITDMSVAYSDSSMSTGGSFGRSLAGGDTVAISVTMAAPPCPPDAGSPVYIYGYEPSSIRLISAVGRHLTVQARPLWSPGMSCVLELPTGPQPEDPVAARTGVVQAFDRTYGGDAAVSSGAPVLIDRPDGLDEVTERARRGSQGKYIGTTTAVVTQVSFDRPDHAWVLYELRYEGNTINRRRGQAVLVDGTWKVTRETVCADLALAQATCR